MKSDPSSVDLRDAVKKLGEMFQTLHPMAGLLERFIASVGTEWRGAALPRDVTKRMAKACFENAYRVAIRKSGRFSYAEGFAYRPGLFPIHHAWTLDVLTGDVVDPTWNDPEICIYLGVIIPIDQVLKKRDWEPGCSSILTDLRGRLNLALMSDLWPAMPQIVEGCRFSVAPSPKMEMHR